MNVVLLGVSDRSLLWRHGKIKKERYKEFVKEYASFLAERFDNVIITPDDGVYLDLALEFGKIKNKKPIAFYPDKDEQYGFEHLKKNFKHFEMKPINGDWYKLNAELTKQAPLILVLGFSPGVLIELSYVKYHQKYGSKKDPKLKEIKVLIDERCIDRKLPKGVEEGIENLVYFRDLEELEKMI